MTNGWEEWGKHVLEEQRRFSEACEKIHDRLVAIEMSIAVLKVKSGVWGFAAGSIPIIIMIILKILKIL